MSGKLLTLHGWQDLIGLHEARTSSFELHGKWAGQGTSCRQPGIYLVEKGDLLITLEGRRYRLGAGDIRLLPRSTEHLLSSLDFTTIEPIGDITARARLQGETLVVGQGNAGLRVRSVALLGRPLTFSWLPGAVVLNGSSGPSPLRHMTLALIEEVCRGTHAALWPCPRLFSSQHSTVQRRQHNSTQYCCTR